MCGTKASCLGVWAVFVASALLLSGCVKSSSGSQAETLEARIASEESRRLSLPFAFSFTQMRKQIEDAHGLSFYEQESKPLSVGQSWIAQKGGKNGHGPVIATYTNDDHVTNVSLYFSESDGAQSWHDLSQITLNLICQTSPRKEGELHEASWGVERRQILQWIAESVEVLTHAVHETKSGYTNPLPTSLHATFDSARIRARVNASDKGTNLTFSFRFRPGLSITGPLSVDQ